MKGTNNMAKTKEELMQLRNEYEALNNKLKELTKEELQEVVSGRTIPLPDHDFWETWNPYFNYDDINKK